MTATLAPTSPAAPFALAFAQARKPEPVAPYAYDKAQQLNVTADGRPVAADHKLMAALSTTTSTAGSKTHFDD